MPRLASVSLHPALVVPITLVLLAMSLVFGTGCNSHPLTNFDAGPQIMENGISVPVPPPSLKLAPVQRVDIEGELGANAAGPDTRVFLLETRLEIEDGRWNPSEDDGSFFFEGVLLDLSNNCIEMWSEDAESQSSVHSFFVASIADDDQSVLTEQLFNGCP